MENMDAKAEEGLLKYESPLLVGPHDKKINWNTKILTAADMAPAITGTTKLLDTQLNEAEIREFLDAIFPPIEWEEEGENFCQHVSSVQATEDDLKKLEKEMDQLLVLRHALDDRLCDTHREIYDQCLDELLRQVTISNPERGFVLRRVRDELRMTFDVYKQLYEGSVAYTARKSMLMQSTQIELDRIVAENNESLSELREHVELLQKGYDELQQEQAQLEEADQKRRREEIDFYKDINFKLKAKLQKFLSRIKKVSSGDNASISGEGSEEDVDE